MKTDTQIKHVALQCDTKKHADIFFNKILGLDIVKTFNLAEGLSYEIFGLKKEIEVIQYANNNSCFEIFITDKKKSRCFDHVCIEIDDKKRFFRKCQENNINPLYVRKGEKVLLFIKDFFGNIYEIKERK